MRHPLPRIVSLVQMDVGTVEMDVVMSLRKPSTLHGSTPSLPSTSDRETLSFCLSPSSRSMEALRLIRRHSPHSAFPHHRSLMTAIYILCSIAWGYSVEHANLPFWQGRGEGGGGGFVGRVNDFGWQSFDIFDTHGRKFADEYIEVDTFLALSISEVLLVFSLSKVTHNGKLLPA